MPREWRLAPPVDVPPALRAAVGGHPLVARLLAQRGLLDPAAARAFLDPNAYTPTSPTELAGMNGAVALVRDTVRAGGRIRVWGDFDADGVTATAVLVEALAALGAAADYGVPRPTEGHGLQARAVDEAIRDGIALLITCDTGIGDADLVARAVAGGVRVIVTDHHDLPERLPPTDAIINPNGLTPAHPLRHLAGVGVAYMLARALLPPDEPRLEATLDLVALGLVADLAQQVGEVRYLIQRGLATMRGGGRPGLVALLRSANLSPDHLSENEISFGLAPWLNSAGRLADADAVVRLLLTRDEPEAAALAGQLEGLNRDRRALAAAVLAQAQGALQADPERARAPALVLEGEGWEPAVLGLVATDLARRYGRPCVLISHRPGAPSIGSARSRPGLDLHAAIAAQRALLLREGGHPMAAGFSIERALVPRLREALLAHLAQQPLALAPAPPLELAAALPWDEVTLDLARQVARLAPFGPGNPRPVFVVAGGTLLRVEPLSIESEGPHRRMILSGPGARPLQATWFNAQELPQPGEDVDLAVQLVVNYWRDRARLELHLVDWRPSVSPARPVGPALVAGREIVDLRAAADPLALTADLAARHGDGLAVWAEGMAPPPTNAAARPALAGRRADALAILVPPPDAATLAAVLAALRPGTIYLLPPLAVEQHTVGSLLRAVAGMVRAAIRQHGGRLDPERMAARLGLTAGTVLLALRLLAARGHCILNEAGGALRAAEPAESTTPRPQPTDPSAARLEASLARLLREIHAYREAYRTLPVEALLGALPER
ncbi:MAG: single-stranded-DNA-specific exonuclease RecJ [Chloroflexota bacterium]